MAKVFLKVDKDLFSKGLNPTEILILAQIIEFDTNTGDCFISDKQLAEQFGISIKTVSRAIEALENKGFITRKTKNVKNGKERHIKPIDKMTIVEEQKETAKDKLSIVQKSNCPLSNRQNDFIKDKGKEKIKYKKENETQPEAGSIDNPIPVKKEWLAERYNNLTVLANDLYMYGRKFYRMEG